LWGIVSRTEVPSEIIAALREFNELAGKTGRVIIHVTGFDGVVGVSPEGFKAKFVDHESGLTMDYSAQAKQSVTEKVTEEPRGGPIYGVPMPPADAEPEIGTMGWYRNAPQWAHRGVVHSIFRLLEQQAITRTKAVELLRYASVIRRGGRDEPPRAPWSDLNWCSDGMDGGESRPEIDDSWVCAKCGRTQAEHELIQVPIYQSSPKIRACVSKRGYGIAYVPRAEYERTKERVT
jgi:hypothetical protein